MVLVPLALNFRSTYIDARRDGETLTDTRENRRERHPEGAPRLLVSGRRVSAPSLQSRKRSGERLQATVRALNCEH